MNAMKAHIAKHRIAFGTSAVIIALAVAALYYVVVPEEAAHAVGIQRFILLYGHTICWLLLATAGSLWTLNKARSAQVFFAYAALGSYVIFMATLIGTKYL